MNEKLLQIHARLMSISVKGEDAIALGEAILLLRQAMTPQEKDDGECDDNV